MKPSYHFDAVQAGVFDAFDGAIRNATSCPTEDTFHAIQEGVRLAFSAHISEKVIREAITEALRLAVLELVRKP